LFKRDKKIRVFGNYEAAAAFAIEKATELQVKYVIFRKGGLSTKYKAVPYSLANPVDIKRQYGYDKWLLQSNIQPEDKTAKYKSQDGTIEITLSIEEWNLVKELLDIDEPLTKVENRLWAKLKGKGI
jgi:HEPN domain-containing protein